MLMKADDADRAATSYDIRKDGNARAGIKETSGLRGEQDGVGAQNPDEEAIEYLASKFRLDNEYREATLSMTASENHMSKLARVAGAGLHGSFYEFGPPYAVKPGEWGFPDSGAQAAIAAGASRIGCQLFEAETFDWRPNGGSNAEQVIMLANCRRGDAFMHFAHKDGGHFALEELADACGIQVFHLPMVERTLLIDVDRLRQEVEDHPNITAIILDQSFKLRWQPLEQIRAAVQDKGVFLAYDASHDAGLIAGHEFSQPTLLGFDAIHGNTHKTIPGPQKAFIAFRDRNHPKLRAVSEWVCPKLQSNCHVEQLAPLTIALAEMQSFGRPYARQIRANAKALAQALVREGFRVSGESFGYTETHQVHVVLGTKAKTESIALDTLPLAGIRTNPIEIPGTRGMYGLRLGTQALTRRGMRETEMSEIAKFYGRLVMHNEEPRKVRADVAYLACQFPLTNLPYSFDRYLFDRFGEELLEEILR